MNHSYRLFALTVCSLIWVAPAQVAWSQIVIGAVQGTVRDQAGQTLSGVTLSIRNRDNGSRRSVRTDNFGRYRAAALPLGNYEIVAARDDRATIRQSGIALEVGKTLNVNFTLGPFASGEAVNLTLKTALVELDRKQLSFNFNQRFLQNLPVYGRKFMDLGIMVPGATEFGERETTATADFGGVNHFYSNAIVDGVDAYQAWTNQPKGKFLVPFEFSNNAIREFQILHGNFDAEFGRSGGGMINVVTKSGSNSWHGDGSYLFSDSVMNATPRFAFKKPETRQQQFGGSIGGPLSRDRLFIFNSYDQFVRREPAIVTSGATLDDFDSTLAAIEDPDERRRFTEAGDMVRSHTGDFDRAADQYTYLGRADWNVSEAHAVSVRFNYQHLRSANVPENNFSPPVISGSAISNNGRVEVANSSLAFQWNAAVSPRVLNEMRAHYAVGTEDQLPNAGGPQARIGSVRAGFTFGRRDVLPASLREVRWQWLDTVTLLSARQEFKFGVDLHRISDRNSAVPAASGAYQFNNVRDFANGRYMTYTQGFGVPDDTTVSPYYSVFAQDNVKLASTLTMNAGIRYEYQGLKATSLANPMFPQTGYVPADKNNFAPRLAFSWQPLPKLAARASYGIYYGPLPIQVNSVARTQNGVFQTVREFRGPTAAGAPEYPQVLAPDPRPQTPAAGARIVVFSPDFASAYIQQANLELEREISNDLSVSSGWIYTKGTRLRSNVDLNLFPPSTRILEIRDTTGNSPRLIAVPYFGGPASRPFPFFDQITEYRSDNNSVYHAFFVQLQKRYSRGLQFLANYTVSKLIDGNAAPGNQLTCCSSENPFSRGGDRGLGKRDQRQRFNLAAVWDLPAVSSGSAFVNGVLNGWRVNSIAKVGSGRPTWATVTGDQGGDVNGDGVRGDFAPAFGRSLFVGPGYSSVDLALHRVFSKESRGIEIGLEAYNLFNQANYLRPFTDYFKLTYVADGISRLEGPLPSFGKTFDATRSREVQVVVRISF